MLCVLTVKITIFVVHIDKWHIFTYCLCCFSVLEYKGSLELTKGSCFNRRELKRALIPQVPGLYKSSSLDSLSTTKIKPLVPARVSGLSKRPARGQKRKHHNAENKPGVQIKISELWRNFGFKK